ncbi:HK97 family phage prohead protease [Candidatus Fokinia crypta]|uniref:HK97 family phage prohead protease n=1 Tax=Candidatus Fokinia crypta TaxID=1920990 RepID=A0ABZ0UNA0_9RICK|nr:HK97 family phage prohead protease [Candidatus Fokinia cryptica]WPX97598.1 HK97 family phage prohead protease [Candidatus Fokinia cryptica]
MSDQFHISGYATVFEHYDLNNDVIKPHAFENPIPSTLPLLWEHASNQPVGYTTSIEQDEYGLYISALIILTTKTAREVKNLICDSNIRGLSIGFIPISTKSDPRTPCRIIHKAKLLEISIVTIPSNYLAHITYFG